MSRIIEDISVLRYALKDVLLQMGGEALINEFGAKFIEIHGRINLELYGVRAFYSLLKKFPNEFKLVYNNGACKVFVIQPIPVNGRLRAPTMQEYKKQCAAKNEVLNRFLADCYQSVPKDALEKYLNPKSDQGSTQSTQHTENISTYSADLGLTLDQVKEIYGLLNPYLEDIVQEFFGVASFLFIKGEIERALKLQMAKEAEQNIETFSDTRPLSLNKDLNEDSVVDLNISISSLDKLDEEIHPDLYEPSAAHIIDKEFDELDQRRENKDEIFTKPLPKPEENFDDSFESLESLSEHQKRSFVNYKSEYSLVYVPINNRTEEKLPPDFVYLFDDLRCYYKYPKHLRDINFKLPEKPKLTKDEINDQIILFSESNSALVFWFCTIETRDRRAILEDRMKEAYEKLNCPSALRVAPENIKPGLLVYSYHEGLKGGYRARINRVCGERVNVFYIDYGTTDTTHMENIKYLMNDFLDYPELCYRGRLHGVQPYEDIGFSVFEQTYFVDIVSESALKAELKFYDEELDTYELKLTFNRNGKDLAENLIKNGICEPIPEDILMDRAELLVQPVYYLISTHECLENGLTESYETRIAFEERGIDMNILADTNYFMNPYEPTNAVEDLLINDYLKEFKENFSVAKKRDNN